MPFICIYGNIWMFFLRIHSNYRCVKEKIVNPLGGSGYLERWRNHTEIQEIVEVLIYNFKSLINGVMTPI